MTTNKTISFDKIVQDTSSIGVVDRREVRSVGIGREGYEYEKNKRPFVFWNPVTELYNPWTKRIANIMYNNVDVIDMLSEIGPDGEKREKAQDVLHFFKLLRNLDKDNRITVYNDDLRSGCPATKELIINNICGFTNEQSGRKFIAKLKKLNILVEYKPVDTTATVLPAYYINPVITMHNKGFSLGCYSLFKPEIDKYLTPAAKKDLSHLLYLQAHPECDLEMLNQIDKDIVESYNYDVSKTQEQHFKLFVKTVLHGDKPQLIAAPAWGTLVSDEISATENVFFLNQVSRRNGTRKSEDICTYRNVSIDIDCGKDKDGKYITDMAALEAKKLDIYQSIRPYIPAPSVVVLSRDGFHIHYACKQTTDKEIWLLTAQTVASALKGLIDEAVTVKADQILRMPCSVHHKQDKKTGEWLDPYSVTLVETNDLTYDYEALRREFITHYSAIANAVISITDKYPEIITTTATKNTSTKEYSEKEKTARIAAISSLSTETFVIPEKQKVMDRAEAKAYYKSQSLQEFLQVSGTFRCLNPIHEDHNPSATITSGNRYYCNCVREESDGKGLDIINVVQMLANCNYTTAVKYLATIFNVKVSY